MAAAHLIPNFLQLPIEGLEAEEAARTQAGAGSGEAPARARDAALSRNGALRMTQALRFEVHSRDAHKGAEQPETPVEGAEECLENHESCAEDTRSDERAGLSDERAQDARADSAPSAEDSPESWWHAAMADLGAGPGADALLATLRVRHDAQGRRFHSFAYVAESLRWLGRWQAEADDVNAVATAILFGRSVFDPARVDNVPRSAEFARASLTALGVDAARVRGVRDLILTMRPDAFAGSRDARLLADVERAHLAEAPPRFEALEAALRDEYAHMADFIYWRRRAQGIRAMLARAPIFQTDAARRMLEEAARANLSRQLEALQRGR